MFRKLHWRKNGEDGKDKGKKRHGKQAKAFRQTDGLPPSFAKAQTVGEGASEANGRILP